MLVSEVKRIGKVGEKLLENKNAEERIEILIEKPLQKAFKQCIEKKRINKVDVIEIYKKRNLQTFLQAGKGYAWLMLNFNTLSDENKEILFSLEEQFGEDCIWFVKSSYVEWINPIRKKLKLKQLVEKFDDKYAEEFKEKQILLMYNNNYPRRNVFIRMPIDNDTKVEEVELYFETIISKLKKQ